MEYYSCTPELLQNDRFLKYCGTLFALAHPEIKDYSCIDGCSSQVEGHLVVFIYNKMQRFHEKHEIKSIYNWQCRRSEIVHHVVFLEVKKDRRPKIVERFERVLVEKIPDFKHLNLKN